MREGDDRTTARRGPAGSANGDPGNTPRRSRREGVTWVALGLIVAVALAFVSRVSADDPSPHHAHSASRRREHTDQLSSASHTTTTATAPRKPGLGDSDSSKSSVADLTTATSTTTVPATTTTVPATTTTVAAKTSTRTETPTTTPPGPLMYRGSLGFPSDVATSIPFVSHSGLAAARVTWSNGEQLIASLRCRGASESAPGRHGISISIDGAPGACLVSVALAGEARGRVDYTVTIIDPAVGH